MAKTAPNGKILGVMVDGYNNIQPYPILDTVRKKKGGQVKSKKTGGCMDCKKKKK